MLLDRERCAKKHSHYSLFFFFFFLFSIADSRSPSEGEDRAVPGAGPAGGPEQPAPVRPQADGSAAVEAPPLPPLRVLRRCRPYLGLSPPRPLLPMILRYPSLFRLFRSPTSSALSVALTPAASALADRQLSLQSSLPAKLHRLLMLAPHGRLLLAKLAHLAPDLGLPRDFPSALCPATPTASPSSTPPTAAPSSSPPGTPPSPPPPPSPPRPRPRPLLGPHPRPPPQIPPPPPPPPPPPRPQPSPPPPRLPHPLPRPPRPLPV
uniref:PORR domain-containing protein n=1 Tax=Ananas comosus var. bracteatus TaxID=296719 RepID=A0A6V7Q0E9_ANACO|nr:unnamed protein product [Ananas comosus var. bracteatus]